MELAQRGGPSASRSSAAPQRREVVCACERACVVPCRLQVARDRAAQQNAAVDGAVLIPREEVSHWQHSMATNAAAVVPISAAVAAAARREAGAAHERQEAEAAVREAAANYEAHTTQETIAKREAHVSAFEEALTKERAPKGSEERAHANAVKQEALKTARRKVAEEKARSEAEISVL